VKGVGPNLRGDDLDAIEEYLRSHGADRVTIEAAPWLDSTAERLLGTRGYVVIGNEDVVTLSSRRSPDDPSALAPAIGFSIDAVADDEWPEVMRRCYELDDDGGPNELIGAIPYVAGSRVLGIREAGQWIACAQAAGSESVVVFGNDGTHPAARGRGAQAALIRERIAGLPDGATAVAEVEPNGVSGTTSAAGS
jgi:hypothetical protein